MIWQHPDELECERMRFHIWLQINMLLNIGIPFRRACVVDEVNTLYIHTCFTKNTEVTFWACNTFNSFLSGNLILQMRGTDTPWILLGSVVRDYTCGICRIRGTEKKYKKEHRCAVRVPERRQCQTTAGIHYEESSPGIPSLHIENDVKQTNHRLMCLTLLEEWMILIVF